MERVFLGRFFGCENGRQDCFHEILTNYSRKQKNDFKSVGAANKLAFEIDN